MRIIDKYIIKNFLPSFCYCLILFVFLYVIIDLFGHLDEILKNGMHITILKEYYFSMIPLIFTHTSPLAALISTIYVISTMNKYDEITAMRAAGIHIFRILAPLLYLGIAISIAVFFVSEKMLPINMKHTQSIKENYIEKGKKNNANNNKTIYNIALYGKNNKLIFIGSYDIASNIAYNITILEQDENGNVVVKTNAHEGKWSEGKWTFSNILIYKLDNQGMLKENPLFFENKTIDLENPKDLISKGTNYEFMSFKDLSIYIRNFSNTSPDIINRLRVDLHHKISFPLTSLVIILIGAAFAIRIKQRGRAAAIMGMGMSILIGFIYYAFMATFMALGKGGILPPIISAHLANIVFGTIGVLLIRN